MVNAEASIPTVKFTTQPKPASQLRSRYSFIETASSCVVIISIYLSLTSIKAFIYFWEVLYIDV